MRTCTRFPAQTAAHATGSSNPIAIHGSRSAKSPAMANAATRSVEDDHQRDRRALRGGVGNAPRDVDDVGRTPDAEESAEHAAEQSRRRCPRSPERPPRATVQHDVQRIAADEDPK
jgi:hypothetical protein